MPTYTVTLKINVPSFGERTVPFPNIVAPTLAQAVDLAKANVVIEAIGAQRTA